MNNQERFVCGKCVHYIQHYRKNGAGYSWVYCGHCVYSRVKHRRPDAKACGCFEKCGTLETQTFAARGET